MATLTKPTSEIRRLVVKWKFYSKDLLYRLAVKWFSTDNDPRCEFGFENVVSSNVCFA